MEWLITEEVSCNLPINYCTVTARLPPSLLPPSPAPGDEAVAD